MSPALGQEQGIPRAAPYPIPLPACIPWGKGAAPPRPLCQKGSPELGLQMEISNSHFPFIKLTKCPAGEQTSAIDSIPLLGPIGLLHFNIY